MLQKLHALVPPLLRALPPASPEDEAAFDAYAGGLTSQLAVLGAGIMMFFTVAWWPLDLVVLPDPTYVQGFADLRLRALGAEVLALVVFLGIKPKGRWAVAAGTVCYGFLLASFGYSLGALGPEHLALLADAYMGIVPIAFIPLRLGWRVVATTLLTAVLPATFFLPHPANWGAPGTEAQVSFLVFAALFAMTLGELSLRVTRRLFFEQRALDRANEALARSKDTLTALVEERTEELRALASHLGEVQETERRRIAQDLHDDLGQGITAMRYTVARLEARMGERDSGVGMLVEDLAALLDGTTTTLRAVVSRLRPRILDDHGLEAAAEWLCEQIQRTSDVACHLDSRVEGPGRWEDLDAATSLVLFRGLQEATTNALKHGEPTRIDVALVLGDESVSLVVKDDGQGFDPGARTSGFGLLGLRERVGERHGELVLRRADERGTELRIELPRTARGSSAPAAPTVEERA